MKYLEWQVLSPKEQERVLQRPETLQKSTFNADVKAILDAIAAEGDAALYRFAAQFDRSHAKTLRVPTELAKKAWYERPQHEKSALETARKHIFAVHSAQLFQEPRIDTSPGVQCFREVRPLDRVGFYIPGGSAPLVSTVLMLGVPSLLAKNPERILCSPPQADGRIHPAVLAAAYLCEIDEIYAVGGAHAIAAMGFGTATLPKVDKVFGPGNSWVTEAKRQLAARQDGVPIDMPAGPSELLVIADGDARPDFIAADLLSQAEHGADSQVILIASSRELLLEVQRCIDQQLIALPRFDIAQAALAHSAFILSKDIKTAIEISNRYAPEHLSLHVEDPRSYIPQIKHAGSVFLGPWSPEAAGDYASGTNHVLPTAGYARWSGGISLSSFTKTISFQELSKQGLTQLAPTLITLANLEGLGAHSAAVSLRLAHV